MGQISSRMYDFNKTTRNLGLAICFQIPEFEKWWNYVQICPGKFFFRTLQTIYNFKQTPSMTDFLIKKLIKRGFGLSNPNFILKKCHKYYKKLIF